MPNKQDIQQRLKELKSSCNRAVESLKGIEVADVEVEFCEVYDHESSTETYYSYEAEEHDRVK